MKTSKSPESAEVTPSKKILKQARLPFKLISETSPVPITAPCRKRKLSASDAVSLPKIGKITKQNEIICVISDDDSKDGTADKGDKIPNPYVKLVNTAIKKKQKSKAGKKKKNNRKKCDVKENGIMESDTAACDDDDKMDVDEPNEENDGANTDSLVEKDSKETENVNTSVESVNIVVLEDSNSSLDVKLSKTDDLDSTSKSECNHLTTVEKSDDKISTSEKITTKLDNDSDTQPDQSQDNKSKESPKAEENSESSEKEIKIPITPKRSMRNKAKSEENNNKGQSSKLNDSVMSNQSSSKQTGISTPTKLDQSANETTLSTNLTPKQLQKKLESAKKREKLEKEKQERERKRQEEKEERAKQRQEKEDQKRKEREEKEEAKRKEREEKEEQRKKEKEEKEKLKELEKKQREDKEEQKRKEKEEKEEQRKKEREAREEERRKRQEALELEKLEQEAKKKKAAEAFANFFVPKQKVEKDQPTVGAVNNSMLSSFTLKADMRLAPTIRVQLTEEKAKILEKLMNEQNTEENKLYMKSLKSGTKPLTSGKTWPLCEKDDDVILVEDELPPSDGEIITCDLAPREKLRPKLFSFHENRRPPYWGTWRKKSNFVKPRKPFGQDEKQLDYEVDSDDDWEEEAEGESLDGSAAGSDDEQDPNDEYEVDNEVFVPHGYLSDEEATLDEDDVLSLSPETQKARLKHLEDEFESEMKKPTEKLKPRLYGLLWENSDGGKPENCADAIWNYFGKLAMIMDDPTPLLQPSKELEEIEKKKIKKKKTGPKEGDSESPKPDKKKKVKTMEEKEQKPVKIESKKNVQDTKKNQPGINMFLKKIQSAQQD